MNAVLSDRGKGKVRGPTSRSIQGRSSTETDYGNEIRLQQLRNVVVRDFDEMDPA